MQNNSPTITDVLSGKESLKFEISFSTLSLVYISVAVLIAVAAGVYIGKKVQ